MLLQVNTILWLKRFICCLFVHLFDQRYHLNVATTNGNVFHGLLSSLFTSQKITILQEHEDILAACFAQSKNLITCFWYGDTELG